MFLSGQSLFQHHGQHRVLNSVCVCVGGCPLLPTLVVAEGEKWSANDSTKTNTPLK